MKKAVMKPTAADIEAGAAAAEAVAAAAAKAVIAKKNEYTLAFDDLTDAGDAVGIRRLRNEITELERAQKHAEEDVQLHRKRLERSRAISAAAAQAQVFVEFDRLSQLMYNRAQMLREQEVELAAGLDEYCRIGLDLQRMVDGLLAERRAHALAYAGMTGESTETARRRPTAVSVADFRPLFSVDAVMQLSATDLAVFSNGRWPVRNLSVGIYQLSQGPRLDDQVREYLKLLRRHLIEAGITPPPTPPAAA